MSIETIEQFMSFLEESTKRLDDFSRAEVSKLKTANGVYSKYIKMYLLNSALSVSLSAITTVADSTGEDHQKIKQQLFSAIDEILPKAMTCKPEKISMVTEETKNAN